MRRCISYAGLVMLLGCIVFFATSTPRYSLQGTLRASTGEGMHTAGRDGVKLGMGKLSTADMRLQQVVVIDPGHGGVDEGAKGFDLMEKDLALDIALRLESQLQKNNFFTVLTRREDVYVSLADRASIANQYDHSIFISIHFNQSPQSSANGVEIYYAGAKNTPDFTWSGMNALLKSPVPVLDSGKALAASIQESVTFGVPVVNRGIKDSHLYVIYNALNPAVLVEGGFLSNPFDAQQLKSEEYRERLAASIAGGVLNYMKAEKEKLPLRDFAKTKD